MSARVDRAALWAAAGRLCDELDRVCDGMSPRASRLAARLGNPVAFDQISATPAWFGEPEVARGERLRLAGAAAIAPTWRQTLDGAILRGVAAMIGPHRLERLWDCPHVGSDIRWPPAERGDGPGLAQLGARVLIAAVPPSFGEVIARSCAPEGAPAVSGADAKIALDLLERFGEVAT